MVKNVSDSPCAVPGARAIIKKMENGGETVNKLLIVAPGAQVQHIAQEIVNELNLDAKVVCPDADAVVETVRREFETDTGMVVARGYFAQLIKTQTNVPVVDIVLSGQEMASLLERACRMADHPHPRIAFVGFGTMFPSCEVFARILNADVNIYEASSGDEVPRIVEQAASAGCELIIGGEIACREAKKRELLSLFLDSTRESIETAIRTAAQVLDAMRREQQRADNFSTILNYSFGVMIKLDEEGRFEAANYLAERVFRQSVDALKGRRFFQMPGVQISQMLQDAVAAHRSLYSTIIRIDNDSFVANVAALSTDGRHEGFIVAMQEFKEIEELETAVHQDRGSPSHRAHSHFSRFSPQSPLLAELLEDAKQFAQYDMPIILTGERGLPKEVIAECIHNASLRRKGPFVRVDTSATSPEMQAEYLFGSQEQGTRGIIDSAQNGTLFLLDVQMLTRESQHQLLNVIRNGQYTRVGSHVPIPAAVRVICSTFKNLNEECAAGRFLEPLANTLYSYRLPVPAVKEIPEDIPRILARVMDETAAKYKKNIILTQDAIDLLVHYSWPGNMHEVEVFCEKLTILARSRVVDAAFIRGRLHIEADRGESAERVYVVISPEESELRAALAQAGHNRQRAAEKLGISRSTLWRRMRKFGLV